MSGAGGWSVCKKTVFAFFALPYWQAGWVVVAELNCLSVIPRVCRRSCRTVAACVCAAFYWLPG